MDNETSNPVSTPKTRDKRVAVRCRVQLFDRKVGEERLIDATVVNLSRGGMFIETREDLSPETDITILFPNPDDPESCIEFDGWVIYRNDAGMGVNFNEVGDRAMAYVLKMLNDHPEADSPSGDSADNSQPDEMGREPRCVPRERIHAALIFDKSVPELYGQVTNLNRGGLFVAGANLISPEVSCVVCLIAGIENPPLLLQARVVHVDNEGVGLQFISPDEDALEFIQGLLGAYELR